MLAKINVLRILQDHIKTLRDYRTGRVSVLDICLFYVAPAVLACLLCLYDKLLDAPSIAMLMQAYAILVGLLLNLLVIIFTAIRRELPRAESDPAVAIREETKQTILEETFANLSYCVLIGIFIAVVVLFGLVQNLAIRQGVCFMVYLGSGNFVLTLLMVLKRVHSLLGREFES